MVVVVVAEMGAEGTVVGEGGVEVVAVVEAAGGVEVVEGGARCVW